MSDEPTSNGNSAEKPAGKSKVNPVFFAGPAVAIGASLLAVMISTGNNDKNPSEANAPEEIVSVQSTTPGQPDASGVPAPPAPGTAVAATDGAIAFEDPTLNFSASFPPGSESDPVLKPLRAEALADLEKSKAAAREDYDQRKEMGGMEMAWEIQTSWKYTAKAGDIVSLEGARYAFTGGAHGMGMTDTRIARASTGGTMTFDDMLHPTRSPSPALIIAVCEALKTEKLSRIDSATIFDEPIVCAGPNANVQIEEAKIALAPSTEPDKFGGVFVYFDAYAVGAYAEGPYALTIPQVIVREDLRKEYQPLFSGTVPPNAIDN